MLTKYKLDNTTRKIDQSREELDHQVDRARKEAKHELDGLLRQVTCSREEGPHDFGDTLEQVGEGLNNRGHFRGLVSLEKDEVKVGADRLDWRVCMFVVECS